VRGNRTRKSALSDPPHPLRFARDLSPTGRGESKSVLATRCAPESCQRHWKNLPPSTIASRLNRRWDRPSARSCSGKQMQSQPYNLFRNQAPEEVLLGSLPAIKRKRNAARRMFPSSASRDAARARISFPPPACGGGLGGGTLACRRSTTALTVGAFAPSARRRPGFLGLGESALPYHARPNRGAKDSAPLHGRYPRPPVPVQGCTSQTGRSTGRHDAQAARERR